MKNFWHATEKVKRTGENENKDGKKHALVAIFIVVPLLRDHTDMWRPSPFVLYKPEDGKHCMLLLSKVSYLYASCIDVRRVQNICVNMLIFYGIECTIPKCLG